MSWRSLAMAGVMAMALATVVTPAEAAYVYDNMAQQANSGLPSLGISPSMNGPLGAQFKTNTLSSAVINVQLLLLDKPTDTGSFIVTIVNDIGNAPGAIAIYTSAPVTPASLTDIGEYLVWDSGSIFAGVSPSTNYWVMLTESATTNMEWVYALNSSGTPANLASLYNFYDSGSVVNGDYPFVMRVECIGISEGPCNSNIVDAPEPATIGVLGAGLVALGVAIRRRRNMAA